MSYSVGLISKFMQNPRVSHMNAAKRVLRYARGTFNFGILLAKKKQGEDLKLTTYSDADWCGDKFDRRSTVGYIFFLGITPISWSSRKESVVALSSCEIEYVAACEASCQAVWLCSLMRELEVELNEKVKLLVDNKSTINLAHHPTSHGRSKHIETKFHYIREQVNKGSLEVEYCSSEKAIG